MVKGIVSSKYQLTLPSEVRKTLGIKPGDEVEYVVQGGHLEIRIQRPDLNQVLDEVLASYDFKALAEETGNNAVRYVRESRGLDD